jgi:hypothetical protein
MMAMVNLGHVRYYRHITTPRGSNYVVTILGTTDTYPIQTKNGARLVKNTPTLEKVTIFPQGSVHTMVNTSKSPLIPPSLVPS